MGIKELFEKVMRKKKKIKEYEEDLDVEQKVHQKKLSSNERELNRFLEEERQEKIKKMLEQYRKEKHNETWHGKNMLESQNVVKDNREVLGGKHLFDVKKSKSGKKGGMFFKK